MAQLCVCGCQSEVGHLLIVAAAVAATAAAAAATATSARAVPEVYATASSKETGTNRFKAGRC